jgi:hypothetical protein
MKNYKDLHGDPIFTPQIHGVSDLMPHTSQNPHLISHNPYLISHNPYPISHNPYPITHNS